MERISRAAHLDVGGIEFLVDDRDGRHYFYDINALSNFVADAENVIGFDPFVRLVDYLERRGAGDAGRGTRDAAFVAPKAHPAARIPQPAAAGALP